MGRPKDKNSRRSRAERRKAEKAALASLTHRTDPNDRVLKRREQFSFLYSQVNERTPEGRNGQIDQNVCDAIGQLATLGLFDNHGHDPWDLVRVGRDFEERRTERYDFLSSKVASFERHSPSTGNPPPRSPSYDHFDKLDNALLSPSMERTAVLMLLNHSDKFAGWAQRLINFELAKRGVADVFVDSHSHGHDCYMLGCAIRGLVQLMDASLPARFERRAA
jgi:hypothetical protein